MCIHVQLSGLRIWLLADEFEDQSNRAISQRKQMS